ncbi:MAG: MotA/TolQ/ExbB proton channel family protein [Gemmatimonadetes bacterium]|nr:MotA/TolQ/ExbB proton channel family protein [Gemmatimonadota bacterium]
MFHDFFPMMGVIRYPMYIATVFMVGAIAQAALDMRKPVTARSTMRVHTILIWGFLNALLGVIGTVVGLALAWGSIERFGGVETGLLAGGIKVALYSSIFGLLLLTFAVLAWLVLQMLQLRGGDGATA